MNFSCIKFKRKFKIKLNLSTINESRFNKCDKTNSISMTSITSKKTMIFNSKHLNTTSMKSDNQDLITEVDKKKNNQIDGFMLPVEINCNNEIHISKNHAVKSIKNSDYEDGLYETLNVENRRQSLYTTLKIGTSKTNDSSQLFEKDTKIFDSSRHMYINLQDLNMALKNYDYYYFLRKGCKKLTSTENFKANNVDEIDIIHSFKTKELGSEHEYCCNYRTSDTFSCTTLYNLDSITSF